MNDIQVGDSVKEWAAFASGYGNQTGEVVARWQNWAWVKWPDEVLPVNVRVCNLTRIEPEPVTLTPKYKIDQKVLCDGLGISTVNGVFIGYVVKEHGGIWLDGDLEPVPEPCPTCGKE